MARRCPPGVFCLENMTIFIIITLIIVFSIFLFSYQNRMDKINDLIEKVNEKTTHKGKSVQVVKVPESKVDGPIEITTAKDELSDIYRPPLKYPDGRRVQRRIPRGAVPINIPTQGESEEPRQIGLLTRQGGLKPTILPLMGNRLISNKDYFNYYTISDSNLNLKLPVSSQGKNCVSEYGCDMISDGDLVYVEGYNDQFKATVYENAQYRYIPTV